MKHSYKFFSATLCILVSFFLIPYYVLAEDSISLHVSHTNNELEKVITQVITKTENYINESMELDKRVVLESYGFALGLSYNIDNLKLRDDIEKKIIKSLKEFAFEDLHLIKDIELANLASNHKNFKGAFENIRLQYAHIKDVDLLTSLKHIENAYQKVIKDMFAYVHGMLGGPPLYTRYAMVSVGSLATQMTTPYSDIEYIILLDKHNDENNVYFTNFADLFEFFLIGFGESPIYKADIFLAEFKPYFKYLRKGARVDEHKKPQDINRLYGLINTPEELLAKIPVKIIHEPGNHLTSALLTSGYLDGDVELYSRFVGLFNNVLSTKEYWRCLEKLLRQDLLASNGFYTQMHSSYLKQQYSKEIEVKDLLINIMHMLRTAALFIKSSGDDLVLEPNFFNLIDSLRKDNFLTINQHRELYDLVTTLFKLRLELQASKQSSEAKIRLGELDKSIGIGKLLGQMQDITKVVQGWQDEQKNKQPSTSISDILKAPYLVWNLPKQDHKFVGRGDLLEELQAKLHPKTKIQTADKKQLAMVSVCAGLGGVGKTQLALQYAHNTKHHYTLKAWFQAENLDQLKQQYMEFAIKELGFKDKEPSFERVLPYVKEYLSKHQGWLLVYDNVTSYTEIKDFLPNEGGAIILTTRQQKWPNNFEKIDIEVMQEAEAIELIASLIQRQIQPSEQASIKELVKALGYLPLALGQAGAYIKQNAISFTDYLSLYKEHEQELLLDDTRPEGTDSLPIATTWNLSLEAIVKEAKQNQQPPLALHLLTVCAYLAPEKINKSLLLTWLHESHPKLKNPELILPKIIGQLWQYSMLNKDDDGNITVHRLVQTVVRHQHQQAANQKNTHYQPLTQQWFDVLLNSGHIEFIKKTQVLEDENRKKKLLPHIQTVLKYHETLWPNALQLNLVPILNDIGISIYMLGGSRHIVKDFYQRALLIMEQYYNKNDIKLAPILDSLGVVYRDLGYYEQSKLSHIRALNIKEQYYVQNHIEMAATLDLIGVAYRYLGNVKQSKEFQERALKIKEEHYDKDNVEIAHTLDYLGRDYRDLGDAKKAKELHLRALIIKEKYYGRHHIEVAATIDKLARDYRYLGDAKQAKILHERALLIRENNYGKDNVIVAFTVDHLGRCYRALGEPEQAKILHERAFFVKEKHFGKEHSEIAINLGFLGNAHRDLGDLEKAKELHEKALIIKETFYGKGHVGLVSAIDELGEDYRCLGNIKKAKELHELSLKIKEEYFDKNNIEVGLTLDQLGKVIDDVNLSKSIHERALRIKRLYYEENHQNMSDTYMNIGNTYVKLGDYAKGIVFLEKALKVREKYYSIDNLTLIEILISLSNLYIVKNDVNNAQKHLERALKIRQQYFGVEHKLTKEIEQIIANLIKIESRNGN